MDKNAGYGFLGIVISSGILGFVIDKFAGTQPWGLMGFLVIGFVYATYKAQKSMQKYDSTQEDQKDDKKA